MVANVIRWAGAGLDAVHACYRGSTGFAAGFSNLTAASTPGTGSGMRRLLGAQAYPIAVPDTVKKPILGDDGVQATFQFQSADTVAGTLELGVEDVTWAAAADGSTNYTLGDWTMNSSGGAIGNPGDFMFLVTRQASGKDSSNDGSAAFENEIWMNMAAVPLGDEGRAHQREGKFRYALTADTSSSTPWGVSVLSAFGLSVRHNLRFITTNRLMMHTIIGDGSTAAFVVDYTPVSATKTKAFTAAGAAAAIASITAGTKTITFSSAPANTVVVVILYECTSF